MGVSITRTQTILSAYIEKYGNDLQWPNNRDGVFFLRIISKGCASMFANPFQEVRGNFHNYDVIERI